MYFMQSSIKGCIIGVAYLVGVIIAAGGVATIPQGKAFALAPNQFHIIGKITVYLFHFVDF